MIEAHNYIGTIGWKFTKSLLSDFSQEPHDIYHIYHKFETVIAGNCAKIKNTDFLLNGSDVSTIYFEFLSGPFYHSLSKTISI